MNRPPPPNGIKVLAPDSEDRIRQEIDQLGGRHEGLATALAAEGLVARQAEEISRQREELRQDREDLRHDREVLRGDRQRLMDELSAEKAKLTEERESLRKAAQDLAEQAEKVRAQLRADLQAEVAAEREQVRAQLLSQREQAQREIAEMREHARAEATALHARSVEAWKEARAGAQAHYEQAREHAKQAQERARADSEKASSELKIAGEAVGQTIAVMKQAEELRQLVARPPQPQKSGVEVFGSLAETALGFFWNTAEGLLKEHPGAGKDLLGALASRIGQPPSAPTAIASGGEAKPEAPATPSAQPTAIHEQPPTQGTVEQVRPAHEPSATVEDMAFLGRNQGLAIKVMGELAGERNMRPEDLPLRDVVAEVKNRLQNAEPQTVEIVHENP